MSNMWSNILKKDKVKKKNTVAYKGQQVLQTFEGKFKPAYLGWKKKCQNAKAGTVKTGTAGGDGKQPNLFEFVLHHVTDQKPFGVVRRPNSPNADGSGITQTIDKLDEITAGTGIVTDKDIKNLKRFKRKLERMKEDVDLNPANIPFTTPEDISGGRAKYPKKPNTFGHYRTPLYNKLARSKGQKAIKIPSSYYASGRDFSARPPFYQALFGEGSVVQVGLLEILEIGIQELDDAENFIVIRQLKDAGDLASIPAVAGIVSDILKNPASNDSTTGELKMNQMARIFAAQRFQVNGATEEKYVRSATGLEDLEGEITGFKVELSGAVFQKLMVAVFGNKLGSKRSAGGFYIHGGSLDYRQRVNGKPINHPREKNAPKEDVQKSWMGTLWNGN